MKKIIIILIAAMLFSCNFDQKVFYNKLDQEVRVNHILIPANGSYVGTIEDYRDIEVFYEIKDLDPVNFEIVGAKVRVNISIVFE